MYFIIAKFHYHRNALILDINACKLLEYFSDILLDICDFIFLEIMENVFIYGTLKNGNPNHCQIANPVNGQAKFVCNAITKKKYPLVVGTTANIPFLINKEGFGNVRYLVFSVIQKGITFHSILDRLELK